MSYLQCSKVYRGHLIVKKTVKCGESPKLLRGSQILRWKELRLGSLLSEPLALYMYSESKLQCRHCVACMLPPLANHKSEDRKDAGFLRGVAVSM